ncbi:60S ribosomal protein L7/l12, partial [Operophtera brumata]
IPVPEGVDKPASPKIEKIVSDITNLNLLEVSELSQVKMTKFDDKQKVALIKEVKSLLEGFNLVQAKKFVESVPTVVKADVSKDEAEKLKEALTKVGAIVEIE